MITAKVDLNNPEAPKHLIEAKQASSWLTQFTQIVAISQASAAELRSLLLCLRIADWSSLRPRFVGLVPAPGWLGERQAPPQRCLQVPGYVAQQIRHASLTWIVLSNLAKLSARKHAHVQIMHYAI